MWKRKALRLHCREENETVLLPLNVLHSRLPKDVHRGKQECAKST